MMNPYYYHGWGMDFGYGGIFMMIFLFLLFILVIWLLLRRGGGWGGGYDNDSALKILNERYAKGDINKEEYEQKKKDLK